MIKNIVFDLGNVLVTYAPQKFINKFVDSVEDQKLLLEKIFYSVEWIQYDRGVISKSKMVETVCQTVPPVLHSTVKRILEYWHDEIKPIEEMEPIIVRLKELGYRLFLLSNAPQDYYQFSKKVPVLNHFDGIFISSDWKKIKPEIAIYQAFLNHFSLIPSQCYFIDDLPLNVESAMNAGMEGCVFRRDICVLKRNFEKAGIV